MLKPRATMTEGTSFSTGPPRMSLCVRVCVKYFSKQEMMMCKGIQYQTTIHFKSLPDTRSQHCPTSNCDVCNYV